MSVYSNIPGSGGKTIPIDLIWEGDNIKCQKCNKFVKSSASKLLNHSPSTSYK